MRKVAVILSAIFIAVALVLLTLEGVNNIKNNLRPSPAETQTAEAQASADLSQEASELLCVPEQKENIDFRVLNTESRPVLEKNSVAWKMLNLGEDEELIARNASTAFLNALNVSLSDVPSWYAEMLERAIAEAIFEERAVDYGFFNEALERFIQDPRYSRFADPEQKFKLFGAVNKGFIRATGDPFAAYLTPRDIDLGAQDYTGTFYGIGAGMGRNENNEWEIPNIMEGGPSEKAGLRAHDVLRKVNGKSVVGCTVAEIIIHIRGKKDTSVAITVERDGERFEFTVVRGEIRLEYVQSWPSFEWPDGRGSTGKTLPYSFPLKTRDGREVTGVAYVQFTSFDLQGAKDLYYVLAQMPWEQLSGLILDLRGNPGGVLSSAEAATGYFLPPETVLLYRRDAKGQMTVHRSPSRNERADGVYFVPNLVPEDMPVVLLVNGGSASASELLAGALQDYGRAVLVGERTAGKGTVNRHFLLRKGEYGDLYIATELWETPKRRFIEPLYKTEEGGLLPDVVVEQSIRFDPENDENIFRALEVLLGEN